MTPLVALDVQYLTQRQACAAAVVFEGWSSPDVIDWTSTLVEGVEPYVSGEFYKRELPCLRAVLALVEAARGRPGLLVIDAYVDLGAHGPGLGRRLFDEAGIPVVGIAKTRFREAPAVAVTRGKSLAPLYVTAAGIDVEEAAAGVRGMAGAYRIPDHLKRVDRLARDQRVAHFERLYPILKKRCF